MEKKGIVRLIIFLFVIMGLAIYSLATNEEEPIIENPIIRDPIIPEEDDNGEEEYIPEEPEEEPEEEEEEPNNSEVGRPPVVNTPRPTTPSRPSIPTPTPRPPVIAPNMTVRPSPAVVTDGNLTIRTTNVSNVKDMCVSFSTNRSTCRWQDYRSSLPVTTPNDRVGLITAYVWYRSSDGVVSDRFEVSFTNHVRVNRLPIGSRLTITGDPFDRIWTVSEARSGGMLLVANRVFGPELFDAGRNDQEVYDYLDSLDSNFSSSFKNRLLQTNIGFYVTTPDRAVSGVNISGPYNTFAGIVQGIEGNPRASILPVILIRNNQLVTSRATNGIFNIN